MPASCSPASPGGSERPGARPGGCGLASCQVAWPGGRGTVACWASIAYSRATVWPTKAKPARTGIRGGLLGPTASRVRWVRSVDSRPHLPHLQRCPCHCTSTRRKPGSRLMARGPRALERETHQQRPLRGFKAATRGGVGQTYERGSWRDLARSRPGVATDRPTGRRRSGIAHNLVLPGWAKLSRIAPSLPLRLPPFSTW